MCVRIDDYNYFYSSGAGIDFIRQILTYKEDPAAFGVNLWLKPCSTETLFQPLGLSAYTVHPPPPLQSWCLQSYSDEEKWTQAPRTDASKY